jgi:hypothetical protein
MESTNSTNSIPQWVTEIRKRHSKVFWRSRIRYNCDQVVDCTWFCLALVFSVVLL